MAEVQVSTLTLKHSAPHIWVLLIANRGAVTGWRHDGYEWQGPIPAAKTDDG